MRILVAYFSKSGNTQRAAMAIAGAVDGEIYQIKTKKKYPVSFLLTVRECKKELTSGEKPVLAGGMPKVELYDKVLIGFPVWAGSLPPAVIGFLEKLDLKGKDIYPFYTSRGGRPRKAEGVIEAATGGNVHEFMNATRLRKVNLDEWLELDDD